MNSVNQMRTAEDAEVGSDTLLSAYQLLIETTVESVTDDALLQQALVIVAAIRWQASHRYFSALLTAADVGRLRLAAFTAGSAAPSPHCADATAPTCLCGRALIHPGRLLCIDATTEAERPPCDPMGTGTHLILPLVARGHVLGILHVLVEPGRSASEAERSFLIQVATLLGAALHRRRSESEHDRLEMQFLQAQKMEAVGRLAGGVAHDFNNILTAITNYADLGLLKLPAPSPLRHYLEEIIAASDRAALLTQQLLAFSRRQVLAPRVLDINVVIAELGKTLRRLLGADLELTIRTDPGLARILADPALIEQLIINLMVNARDAMPQGGCVAISTANTHLDASYTLKHPAVPPGDYICLAISARDPGSASSASSACRAAALYGQVVATPEPLTGAPLGPVAIFDIIRQGGGHAQVEHEAECGTTLRIYFPVVPADAESAGATDTTYTMPRGSETILLAEDDDSVRVVTVEVLRDLGYQVLEAREGREAISLAADHQGPIHVLVTDVVMPSFGGNELRRHLAATRPDLRVLYVSGVSDDALARHGVADQGAVILQKPFSPWALAARLRQVLDAAPPVAGS